MRRQFPLGRFELKVEPAEFQLHCYHEFLGSIRTEAAVFRGMQQDAFAEERRRWAERGEFNPVSEEDATLLAVAEQSIPAGCSLLRSPTTASVWRVQTENGQIVEAGQRVFILEAMKMEIAVHAPHAGEIVEVLCQPGSLVTSGQPLLIYRTGA